MKRDLDMHTVSIIGALAIFATLVAVPLVYAGEKPKDEEGPALADLEAIEASLAYKKPDAKPRQPEKPKQAPPEQEKPQGVSTDETKKPDPPKPEDPKKPPPKNLEDEFERLRKQRGNPDDEIGKPSDQEVGAFDGSEFGFAEESKGDPYFQKLVGDLLEQFEFPKVLQDAGEPVGCLRLSAEGKIQDTLLQRKSDNSELNDSVERALAALQKLRNQSPSPVPTHLLKAAITKWVCFRFQAKKRE
jgi:hypothetical protein